MTTLAIATPECLLIVRPGAAPAVEQHLKGKSPEPLAVDPGDPAWLYAGTRGDGLWRSQDAGRSWQPVAAGIPHPKVTAVAVEPATGGKPHIVYAGTEPSTLSRSDDGGQSWRELPAILDLPSSSSWSFPPKPDTHHVRWIEVDPHQPGGLFVAIEAGALVRSMDAGESWRDRVPGGPIDTHTAATHPRASGRLYSAAGDGYFESDDGGESWSRPMQGLRHRYLVGVAVEAGDPDTVIVSAASGPSLAYRPSHAEGYLYRKSAGGAFELAMNGLPEATGTIASRLCTDPEAAGVFYTANNHGLFRSQDAGQSWRPLDIDWPEHVFRRGVDALVAFIEKTG